MFMERDMFEKYLYLFIYLIIEYHNPPPQGLHTSCQGKKDSRREPGVTPASSIQSCYITWGSEGEER